jgi:hypothetical protein
MKKQEVLIERRSKPIKAAMALGYLLFVTSIVMFVSPIPKGLTALVGIVGTSTLLITRIKQWWEHE